MKDIIVQVHELAQKVYKPEEVSPLSLYQDLYASHPESFILEIEEGKVLGYIIVCYLSEEDFNLTTKPGFKESQIYFSKQIVKTDYVYFFSIVVDQDLNKPYLARKLIRKFKMFLQEKEIKGFSALIYSPEGERLAEAMGMSLSGNGQYFWSKRNNL